MLTLIQPSYQSFFPLNQAKMKWDFFRASAIQELHLHQSSAKKNASAFDSKYLCSITAHNTSTALLNFSIRIRLPLARIPINLFQPFSPTFAAIRIPCPFAYILQKSNHTTRYCSRSAIARIRSIKKISPSSHRSRLRASTNSRTSRSCTSRKSILKNCIMFL